MSGRREVLAKIRECEKKGEFDRHVDPINYDKVIPVDKDFPYEKPAGLKLRYAIERALLVRPFAFYKNKFVMKTQINGRENIPESGAVVIGNHVNMWDCLVQKLAFRGRKLDVVAAPFNNMRGLLGELMRASDMYPLGSDAETLHRFNRAIDRELKRGNLVLIYPEQSMWWNYEKPRPFKDGAFYFAARNLLPILPTFITFRDSGKLDDEGLPVKYFTEHIMPPIYPKQNLSRRANTDYLRDAAFRACREKYHEVYGKR